MSNVAPLAQEKEAGEGEEQWALSRFVPMLQDILEDLHVSKLSQDEFPYLIHPDKAGALPTNLVFDCSLPNSLLGR